MVNATKNRLPVKLIFYEAYLNKYDAIRREDYFKTSKGKQTLRNMLKKYLSKDRTWRQSVKNSNSFWGGKYIY
mgnify:FL=1